MRRTQLYLDEKDWKLLHVLARSLRTSVSELVRTAVHEKYFDKERRRQAMLGIVGLWKDRTDLPDTETYVRSLRKGNRLERVWR
jgi:hypothetical protein